MAYKTILVHVDNGKHCPARVQIAVELAARFQAYLVGLYALTQSDGPAGRLIAIGPDIVEQQKQRAAEQAAAARATFDSAVRKGGIPGAEWRASSDDAAATVALHARYADLVVLGQQEPEGDSGVDDLFARRAVLASGRPVLMVPYIGGAATLGKRILLAWNATREASRAATDALPFLHAAEQVTAMAVRPKPISHGELPGADIALYLARHGVRVEVDIEEAQDIDVGNVLLSRAADLSSDLIVMGAYGHSRFSELVLGGATRTMFESMTVPVLMSHEPHGPRTPVRPYV